MGVTDGVRGDSYSMNKVWLYQEICFFGFFVVYLHRVLKTVLLTF